MSIIIEPFFFFKFWKLVYFKHKLGHYVIGTRFSHKVVEILHIFVILQWSMNSFQMFTSRVHQPKYDDKYKSCSQKNHCTKSIF